MKRIRVLVWAFCVPAASLSASTAEFHSLGLVDAYVPTGTVTAAGRLIVSGDGRTVAGSSGLVGFTWSPGVGKTELPRFHSSYCPLAPVAAHACGLILARAIAHRLPSPWR